MVSRPCSSCSTFYFRIFALVVACADESIRDGPRKDCPGLTNEEEDDRPTSADMLHATIIYSVKAVDCVQPKNKRTKGTPIDDRH